MLWRWFRCLVRSRPFRVGVGVLVGTDIEYTGASVTSGVAFGGWVNSGVDVGTSTAIAVGRVDVSIGQFSRAGCLLRNCATPKAVAPVSEIIASPIAHRARRRARL